jgi:hypothetical protein
MIALFTTLALLASAQETPNRVTLPLDDFLELYHKAEDPEDPDEAPWDYALSSSRFTGEVVLEQDIAKAVLFQGRLRVENLAGGWIRVPLLPAAVAPTASRIAGVEAPVSLQEGWYTLVTDRKGAFDIDIEFAVAVHNSRGANSFSFPLARSGAVQMELAVPADDTLDITVANTRLLRQRTERGRQVVEAVVPSSGSLSASWQRALPTETARSTARVYAEVQSLVTLGEGTLRANTHIDHTILFAGVDRFSYRVPEGMTVLDVRGSGLRDWTVADDGILSVQLNYEAEGSTSLDVTLERVLKSGDPLDAPVLEPLNVERSKGWVGVSALGAVEVAGAGVTAAAAVDVRTLPASILGVTDQPILLGYKYLGTTAKIPLQASEHEEVDVLVTLLDQAEATTMLTLDGRRLTSVRYQVRNNRRQFLRLKLPEGAELWTANVAGKAVQPARAGSGEVMLPLIRSSAAGGSLAAFTAEVVYVETGEASEGGRGHFEADLPTVDAPTTYVAWTLYLPDGAKISKRTLDGSLHSVEWLSQPIAPPEVYLEDQNTPQMMQSATTQIDGGGMGSGAAPVDVQLPLDGVTYHFEKLLVLGERLWVGFDYSGADT